MVESPLATPDPPEPLIYQIRLRGQLGQQWAAWFGEATIEIIGSDDTLVTCRIVDQAALYGLLKKVRDLGMPLLSVYCLSPGLAEPPDQGG